MSAIRRQLENRYPGLGDPQARKYLAVSVLGVLAGLGVLVVTITRALRSTGFSVSYLQVLAGLLLLFALSTAQQLADRPAPLPPRRDRIVRLTQSLEDAAELADELRSEIEEGEQLVRRAQADLDRYTRLRALKAEEVQAVAQELGAQIRAGDRRNITISVATNVLVGGALFLAGLFVGR